MKLFKSFFREEEGQDGIEYALLAGFVSLTIAGVAVTLGGDLKTLYEKVDAAVVTATP